jgi:hypothetical protein
VSGSLFLYSGGWEPILKQWWVEPTGSSFIKSSEYGPL